MSEIIKQLKELTEIVTQPIQDMIKTLAGPAAEEIGLTLRDSFRVWRCTRQLRYFQQLQKVCAESGIGLQAVKLPLLFDLVDGASMEDDDSLQDLWVNVLANAADSRQEVLVKTAFPRILREISREEAIYLDEMFEMTKKIKSFVPREYFSDSSGEFHVQFKDHVPSKLDPVSYDNLVRVGLIYLNDKAVPVEDLNAGTNQYKLLTNESHLLSAFGGAFVLACRPPKKVESSKGS